MRPETISQKIDRIYEKGCTKNWDDFFVAGIILLSLATFSAYMYPILNLWMAFYPLGIFCIMIFCIFKEGGN